MGAIVSGAVGNAGVANTGGGGSGATFGNAAGGTGGGGGAVLDSHMNLIGVASAGDGTFSSFVSLKDIKAFLGNY